MIINIDSDRFVKEVIEGDEYAFLFNDLVVVDLGCNIGAFSLWIYKLAREIHAIDMVEDNINSLNETIEKNGLDKIKTYCIAITSNNKPRRYNKDRVLGGGGSLILDEGQLLTDCMTLRQFISKNGIGHIDVLKMDIEGMEEEILKAEDFPSEQIHTIIGEIHKVRRGQFTTVKDSLEKMGYKYSEPIPNHFLARKV